MSAWRNCPDVLAVLQTWFTHVVATALPYDVIELTWSGLVDQSTRHRITEDLTSVDIGRRTSDVVEWVTVLCVVSLALRLRF
jgi:hypothetical protein